MLNWFFKIAFHMNIKVSAILARKNVIPFSISPDATVLDALNLMADKNIGSVVVSQDGEYMGIVTERDYSRKVILQGKHSSETKVREIMSDMPRITSEDTVDHCMELMSDKHVRYLPVFDGTRLVGIISMSDVVTETILQQKATIDHLQNYIFNS